jgi:4-amino-4-deoxy-L-arabinose transferase-like glycosyltransferase
MAHTRMMRNNVNRERITSNENRTSTILLLGILALALILRMGWPTLTAFKRDEATVVRRALAVAYEGDLPAWGVQSSTGPANFPLTLYLMAIPLRLWQDPVAVALVTGLLNSLAVLACYLLGRAYFSRMVGLISAFLFAVSPWAIIFGRQIWSQNLPLVTLGFIAALFATFIRGQRWALVGAFVGLAALIGLHLGGLAFIPVLLLAMLLYREHIALKPLLVGALLFGLALAPYAISDAYHGWPNLKAFFRYAGGEGHFSQDALNYAFINTGSYGIHGMAGALYPEYLAGLPNLWQLNWLMMGLLAAALLYGLLQVIRGPEERRRPILLMLIWFAAPIALQSRPTTSVYPFYFNVLYPVQFLFIAVMLSDWLSRSTALRLRWLGRRVSLPALLLIGGLLLWGGWQVAVMGRLFYFMEQHPITGGYGIPLKYTRSVAQEARRLAGSSEIVVLSDGVNPAEEETPSVFEALLFDHPHRFADGRLALPVPDSSDVVYVVGPANESDVPGLQPVMERLEMMERVWPGPVIELPDGWRYLTFRRDGPDREDVLAGMTRFPEEIAFANGTVFLGHSVPDMATGGETMEVWLAWWVRSPPPPETRYHFFVHLLNEEGALLSQHDGSGFPTSSWQAGDLVLSRFSLPIPSGLPSGRYSVWAGLYTYPDVVNVSFLDVAGNPAGERVMLGEVQIVSR